MTTIRRPQPTRSRAKARPFRLAAGVLAMTALLGATACQSDDGAWTPGDDAVAGSAGNDQIPPQYSAWEVPPERIDAAIEQIPSIVERTMDATGVPGMAVAVVHDGEVVFAQGFGIANLTTDAAVDADTTFQIASVSKSVGATVISKQVGEGVISWDDPIVEHLPGFELSDPYVTENVSYADMYSHRSGLPPHVGDTLEDLGASRDEVLRSLRYVPLGPFRVENQYTNFGLTAAGEAAANAAGTTWEELSRRSLYEPLGMTRTTSSYAEFSAQTNRAALHVPTDNGWAQLNTRDADAQSPAGGVSSSVNDLVKWMNLILAHGEAAGNQLVDAKAISEMLSPHSSTGPTPFLDARAGTDDLGFNASVNSTARQTFSHSGAFAMGAGTAFTLVPAENLGIVVLTNGYPLGAAESINAEFLDLALVGEATMDWPALFTKAFSSVLANPAELTDPAPTDPAPAQPAADYVGTWANDYYGAATVTADGDDLTLRVGAAGETFALTHWDGNQFTWVAPGENSPGPSLVTFDPGAGTMTITALNEVPPLGVFTR